MDATVPARPKLLDQMRDKLRVLHYAWETEKSYLAWVERFLRFHKERSGVWRHPTELGKPEIEAYLTSLAVDEHVSPSTQNQAFSAIFFSIRKSLKLNYRSSQLDSQSGASGWSLSEGPSEARVREDMATQSRHHGTRQAT